MRRVWVLMLLSVVACSEKKQGQEQVSGAGQYKSEVALANKDATCPGGERCGGAGMPRWRPN
jgi:hypothetical protein